MLNCCALVAVVGGEGMGLTRVKPIPSTVISCLRAEVEGTSVGHRSGARQWADRDRDRVATDCVVFWSCLPGVSEIPDFRELSRNSLVPK
jgi:hypothetical protein